MDGIVVGIDVDVVDAKHDEEEQCHSISQHMPSLDTWVRTVRHASLASCYILSPSPSNLLPFQNAKR